MIMLSVNNSSAFLSFKTLIFPFSRIVASPIKDFTLFFFNKCVTPWFSCLEIPRDRFITDCKSKDIFSALNPNSFARCIRWKISADRNIAFVGIQPQLRQIPPICSFSTIAVLRPNCALRMAATYPPGPAPITTTSKKFPDIFISKNIHCLTLNYKFAMFNISFRE